MKPLDFVVLASLLSPISAQAFTTDGQEDICADPAVIMCENYESRTPNAGFDTMRTPHYKNNGFGSDNPTDLSVTTTQAFDGTNSFQEHYVAGGDSSPGTQAANLPSLYNELYMRIYVKYSANFKMSAVANKWLYINSNNPTGSSYTVVPGFLWGSLAPQIWFPFSDMQPSQIQAQNENGTITLNLDQWYCSEFHVKMNTAGQHDGLLEGWIDGTRHFYLPNIQIHSVPGVSFNSVWTSGFWNCADAAVCDPNLAANRIPADMYRWYDNWVVSTQRIGCLGSAPPPQNTTPPAAPKGLSVI